jgi:hypothetical protein
MLLPAAFFFLIKLYVKEIQNSDLVNGVGEMNSNQDLNQGEGSLRILIARVQQGLYLQPRSYTIFQA